MSDTSGATDLKPETPPIDAAPPVTGIARSPMQLPSALQGLAKFFTQSQPQAQPSPAPKPKQPPLTEEQASKTPRGVGGPSSFAPAPPNAPAPPSQFTPFIGASDKRDPDKWGDPVNYPRLPQTFELPGLFNQLGNYFAQNGSYPVANAASSLLGYNKEYLEGYMKGQDWKMKMAREGIALKLDELNAQAVEGQTAYKDIYNKYISAAGGDRAKLATQTIGGMNLYDAMHAQAMQLGDKNVIQMFEQGEPLEHVFDYLTKHDQMIRDLQATKQKAADQEGVDASYGLTPPDKAAEPWNQNDQPAPQTPDEAKPDAPTDATSPEWAKGVKIHGVPISPRMISAATDAFKGVETPGLDKDIKPWAASLANLMETEKNKIMDDPNIKPGQYGDAIRKRLGPDVAGELKGLEDYTIDPNRGTQGKEGNYLRWLQQIAAKDVPPRPAEGMGGWNAANYPARLEFMKNVSTQTVINRSNALAADGKAVIADLAELERQGRSATGLDFNQIWKNLAREPMYAKLAGDWKAYNASFNTVVTGGRHVESGQTAMENVAPLSYASPAAFRAAIKGHMNDAIGYLDAEHRTWETRGGTRTDMPGFNPQTEKDLRDMRDMDWLTGTLPGVTFTNKKGVTKRWKGGAQELNPRDDSNWDLVQ